MYRVCVPSMCVHVCAPCLCSYMHCACVCRCVPSTCVHACATVCALCGGQRTDLDVILPQMPSTLISETRFLTGTWSFLRNQAVSLPGVGRAHGQACLFPPCWCLNWGPRVCIASPSPTEPSPCGTHFIFKETGVAG